jgi:hypothetical protein
VGEHGTPWPGLLPSVEALEVTLGVPCQLHAHSLKGTQTRKRLRMLPLQSRRQALQHAPLVARTDAMHFVVRSDAEVIRTLSPKSYEKGGCSPPQPVIPYPSRMTSRIEG